MSLSFFLLFLLDVILLYTFLLNIILTTTMITKQPTAMKDKLGIDEFQKIKDKKDIEWILKTFLLESPELTSQLLTKLRLLRDRLSRSSFFNEHEIIGSSLLVIHYASSKLGVWMIDFAKTVPLPPGVVIDHRSAWKLGNHEDGYLFGLDNLINLVETIK